MKRIGLDQDIKPLKEFRANTAIILENIRKTKRPVLITQNGKNAAIVLDVEKYEEMMYRLELIEAINEGRKQAEQDQVVPHEEVKRILFEKYQK